MEETLYTDELKQLFLQNGIIEELQEMKFNHKYPIVWNKVESYLTITGISYGAFEDLYTVLIEEKE